MVFGIGKALARWKVYRMWSPILSAFEDEAMKKKMQSRKFWITVIVGVVGVVVLQLGVAQEQWNQASEWLLKLLYGYFSANAIEHVAGAIKRDK